MGWCLRSPYLLRYRRPRVIIRGIKRGIKVMGCYETFMLNFAVLVILAGVVLAVVAGFLPSSQQYQRTHWLSDTAAGGADGDGATA